MREGWPCWAISNHDVRRAVTRWGGDAPSDDLARQLVALVCSLRGSVCLYQGEELGLEEAEIPFESLRDPYGIAFWPNFKGRDGCRTPMPWNDGRNAGFSDGTPWLPVPDSHRARNVAAQDADPGSVLNATRAFLRWRRTQPALVAGDITFLDSDEPVLVFTRRDPASGDTLLVAFNLSSDEAAWAVPAGLALRPIDAPGPIAGALDGATLRLPPRAAFFAVVSAG
jgi:alpha-glucosidase